MTQPGVPTQAALGPLNPVEQKFAPAELWLRGNVELLRHHPRVAVIGTRTPSPLGVVRTRKLVKALVAHDVIVVSGLAAGVDTIAHTETIAHGGRTIAVIGTPIDVAFPKENAALQERIATDHLLVSEFRPGTAPHRGNFPRRNRTMALIANASVIIEAGATSGTVSQGWEALRLGRSLFLLQSLLETDLAWPKEMLEYGALPLRAVDDLLAELPPHGQFETVLF